MKFSTSYHIVVIEEKQPFTTFSDPIVWNWNNSCEALTGYTNIPRCCYTSQDWTDMKQFIYLKKREQLNSMLFFLKKHNFIPVFSFEIKTLKSLAFSIKCLSPNQSFIYSVKKEKIWKCSSTSSTSVTTVVRREGGPRCRLLKKT